MSKYNVQAVKRPGFETASRGGRAWPSAAPVEVEVLDQDECPTIEVPDGVGKSRTILDPKRLGRKAWAAVLADARLSKTPVGLTPDGSTEEVATLRARVAELEQKLAEAEAAKGQPVSAPAPVQAPGEEQAVDGTGDASPKRSRSK